MPVTVLSGFLGAGKVRHCKAPPSQPVLVHSLFRHLPVCLCIRLSIHGFLPGSLRLPACKASNCKCTMSTEHVVLHKWHRASMPLCSPMYAVCWQTTLLRALLSSGHVAPQSVGLIVNDVAEVRPCALGSEPGCLSHGSLPSVFCVPSACLLRFRKHCFQQQLRHRCFPSGHRAVQAATEQAGGHVECLWHSTSRLACGVLGNVCVRWCA